MPDISELLIEVKNTNNAVNEIQKVGKALKDTQKQANVIGKTLFAGWTFKKLIQGAKEFGDAWKDTVVTFKNFDTIFGKFNASAQAGVKQLIEGFAQTEKSAKKLMSYIGSRLDFNLNSSEISQISTEFAKLSHEIAQTYNLDPSQVSQKLTNGLSGMTRGLKEFGMNIDTTSAHFKQLVQDMMISTGKTEEAAKAMVIYNEIMNKSKKFQGSFDAQAKTLSQAFDNISNTLTSGPFARAGEILSEIFVPILNKINKIFAIPWVSKIMGIVAALGLVLASVIAIEAAIGGLKAGILKVAASGGLSGAVAAVLVVLKSQIAAIFTGLIHYIVIGAGAVLTFLAGLPAAAVAAIIAVLATAAVLLINKITTGEWFNFSGMLKAVTLSFLDLADGIKNWLGDLAEKVINWWNDKGFKTNAQIIKELRDKIDKNIQEAEDMTFQTNEAYKKFLDSLRDRSIPEQAEDARHRLNVAAKKYQRLSEAVENGKKYLDRITDIHQYEREAEDFKKLTHDREAARKAYEEAYRAYEAARKAEEEYWKDLDEKTRAANEQKRKTALKLSQLKFGDFTWYQDAMRKIQDGLNKTLPQDRIKDIEKRIEEFKKTFEHMTPEEQNKAYKELSRLELQKYTLEMEMLNNEKEAIQKTNEMVLNYLDKALQWKPSGVEGISANTMEGYKFMTSSFGSVTDIGNVLKDNNRQQIDLQKKANDIATTTKSIINDIKNKIDNLDLSDLVTIHN